MKINFYLRRNRIDISQQSENRGVIDLILVDFPRDKNELILHFKTDSYQQLSGFRIEVKQLTSGCAPPENKTCEQTFSSESFQVISPGYQSGSYPDNA
ncbi:cubilin, partial [Nephila pilipes]